MQKMPPGLLVLWLTSSSGKMEGREKDILGIQAARTHLGAGVFLLR